MSLSPLSRRAALALGGASLVSLLASRQSDACLNDRDTDTLVEESRQLPGVVEVITGRFERNPPLYYQMRIDRIQKDLRPGDTRYDLYDDIAVACDRIGKSDHALEWMTKKHHALGNTSPEMPQFHEHWYRYYANTGTSRVHRWIRSGANRQHLGEVKQAAQEITRALQIKPNAHFGRETYQLQIMEWIVSIDRTPEELAEYLQVRDGLRPVSENAASSRSREVVEGLTGLIVLGNAWESVDVFMALFAWLEVDGHAAPAFLAQMRAYELAETKHNSLLRSEEDFLKKRISLVKKGMREGNASTAAGQDRLHRKYYELRAEAEQWHTARTDYMMQRLQVGRHPDTDATFWSGWHPAPPPSLSTGTLAEQWDKMDFKQIAVFAIFGTMLLAPCALIGFTIRETVRWCKKRRASSKTR